MKDSDQKDVDKPEVRYQMLRPGQVVERREACPIAYLPLGNVEMHGMQNPFGADTLQAEGAAIHAAQMGGGLVLPPLWYFAPLHEMYGWTEWTREKTANAMRLSPELRIIENDLASVRNCNDRYQDLLVDLLLFAESLGFRVCVLIAGHYPLIAHASIAVDKFMTAAAFANRNVAKRSDNRMTAWACQEPTLRYLLDNELAGDHGGGWETSNVMHLHPQTVDLSQLPPKGEPMVGCGGKIAPQDATPERGRDNIKAFARLIVGEAHSRLQHPEWYPSPPYTNALGKWREKNAHPIAEGSQPPVPEEQAEHCCEQKKVIQR